MDNLFEMNMALRCQVKAQRKIIDEFKSGKRYLKIQQDHHRVVAGYIKENKNLKAQLASAHAQAVNIRNIWMDENERLWDEHRSQMQKKDEAIRNLEDKVWETERKYDEKIAAMTLDYEERLGERDCIIDKLKNELAHAQALLDRDGTNTGLPTSQTPAGKKKRVPNGRTRSGNPKGGRHGHKKHGLEKPDESEVTGTVGHDPVEEGFCCPSCNGEDYIPTGATEARHEYDVRITVEKIKHEFHGYKCLDCGGEFFSAYPPGLRGEVVCGSGIQALALSLTNTVNAAMNKTAMFIAGMTGSELTPCEGYIAKLQVRAAKMLAGFREDLKKVLITRALLYWDDTVIMVLTKRCCFRFYGDETVAYYTAHDNKGMKGIDEDGILETLTSEAAVMHDHNSINYNEKFAFQNIECNQHLERDCQKNSDDAQHAWSANLKKLIGRTVKDRDKAISEGKQSFSEEYVKGFHEKVDEYLADGWEKNDGLKDKYGAVFERSLLRRIPEYRENYFNWLKDFRLPTTNNLSERSLRAVKSHMKISGQFESVKAADNYALIRSYIETCRRNAINEFAALQRLCDGNPYTVQEILSKSSPR